MFITCEEWWLNGKYVSLLAVKVSIHCPRNCVSFIANKKIEQKYTEIESDDKLEFKYNIAHRTDSYNNLSKVSKSKQITKNYLKLINQAKCIAKRHKADAFELVIKQNDKFDHENPDPNLNIDLKIKLYKAIDKASEK